MKDYKPLMLKPGDPPPTPEQIIEQLEKDVTYARDRYQLLDQTVKKALGSDLDKGHGERTEARLGRCILKVRHKRDILQLDDDGVPITTCPRCLQDIPDHDGFGPLAHIAIAEDLPGFRTPCGYCSHPTSDGVDGKMVCGLCSAVEGTPEWDERQTV